MPVVAPPASDASRPNNPAATLCPTRRGVTPARIAQTVQANVMSKRPPSRPPPTIARSARAPAPVVDALANVAWIPRLMSVAPKNADYLFEPSECRCRPQRASTRLRRYVALERLGEARRPEATQPTRHGRIPNRPH